MNTIPTINELLDMAKKPRNIKNYDEAMNATNYWNRNMVIGGIDSDVGECVDGLIHFWNMYDDENEIPVEERRPIKMYIDSPGGDLTATFTMVDAMKISKTPIWTINMGMAYSGGFLIYIAGHKRFAYPHSSFLYHEGATGIECDAGKFQNYTEFYKSQLEQLKTIVLENTKISEDFYKEIRRDDFWMNVDKAMELGCVDEIIKEFI